MDDGARSDSAARQLIALIDPVSTGHHIEYCRWVAGAILDRGMQCLVVGPDALVDAVQASHPTVAKAAIPFRTRGGRVGREVGKLRFMSRAAAVVRDHGCDVVHLLYLDGFIVALASTQRRFGSATLFATLHSGYMLVAISGTLLWQAWERRALRRMVRAQLRTFVHGAALAEAVADEIAGADPIVVAYPIDQLPNTTVNQTDARERLGLDRHARLLLAFGGTRHDKGVDLAIAALALLPDDVRLVVAGKAEHFTATDLMRIAKCHDVADRVDLHLGFVPDVDVPAWFAAINAVVIPYRRAFTGQSGPLTIAAGLGRPVVASDGWTTGATVRAYRLGITVPPEDVAALAHGVATVLETPPSPDATSFRRDHSLSTFGDRLVASYRRTVPPTRQLG
jgi:glycosyltransferase involved in cell wall biosynthesis